jgi:adenosylcobyric acid synthase
MLGDRIEDAAGVDGSAGGLGLLPLLTRFQAEKITRPAQAQFGSLPHPWSGLSGLGFSGYEIRHGATWPTAAVAEAVEGALGFVHGSVLAIYVHGLFESPAILKAMFGRDVAVGLDETFDELANAVEAALDLSAIDRALEVAAQASS